MRILATLLAAFLTLPAFAYDVTATMPTTAGATSCQLYLGGSPVSTAKPCGSPQTYANLLTADGTYLFQYKAVNSVGSSAGLSPTTTVVIGTVPVNPTNPPTVTVVCTPAPCAQNVVITITP